jgi:monoamine oxidase
VWTDRGFAGIPLELGGEWIHGDRVPTWELVNSLGLHTHQWRKPEDSMIRLENGEWMTMQQARAQYPAFEITRSWDLPDVPVKDGEDFASYLRRIGFTDEQLQYVRRSFSNALCEAPEHISAQAALDDMDHTESGEGDFRIMEGYDRLLYHLAEGLDIRLNTVITAVEWSDGGVLVRTEAGDTFSAEKAVIALPLGILQSGKIQFTPPLPESKQVALKNLRMGVALKLVYHFPERITPPGISAIYSRHNPPMWWSPSEGHHEFPGQLWSAFATGDWARELLDRGEAGALDAGFETLQTELGKPLPTPLARKLANWRDDPFALGGYSVALAGGAGGRAELAKPLEGRLFFAGEATAPNALAATVHGAYISGKRAAQEALEV